jgi:orotate phosphoribosyltransferase
MSSLYAMLIETQAVMFRLNPPFTFSSGLASPIYCDNRMLISKPETRNAILDAFCQNAPKDAKQIAGVATAGIAWAAWLAQRLNLPFVYVRPEPKKHGAKKQIEGAVTQTPTWVIEDLISTGNSSLQACAALRDQGVEVHSMSAIFTYGFATATDHFEQASLNVQTLMNLQDLLPVAVAKETIDQTQAQAILQWQQNPSAWP